MEPPSTAIHCGSARCGCAQDAESDEISGDEEEVRDSDDSGDASPKEGEEAEAEGEPKSNQKAAKPKTTKVKGEEKGHDDAHSARLNGSCAESHARLCACCYLHSRRRGIGGSSS